MKLVTTPNRVPQGAAPRLHRPTVLPSGSRAPASMAGNALHPVVQAQLKIGAPNDEYEQEADHVAYTVMRVPRHGAGIPATSRKMPGAAAGRADDRMQSLRAGQPLTQPMREFFAPRFGHDFSHVRIHTDARAADLAGAIHARAFAIGRDVVFGAGEFAPGTSRGRELMAHELAHVVQHERGATQSSPGTIRRQPKTDTPEFPDFPHLALKLEDDIGQNLSDYGHHFYRLATLFPDRPELLQEAFGRYALGANVLQTGFRFLGLDQTAASRLALGTGILFKGLNFVSKGEVVLDFQFDIGRGLKLETNFKLGVNPEDVTQVRKADVGLGIVGHF